MSPRIREITRMKTTAKPMAEGFLEGKSSSSSFSSERIQDPSSSNRDSNEVSFSGSQDKGVVAARTSFLEAPIRSYLNDGSASHFLNPKLVDKLH